MVALCYFLAFIKTDAYLLVCLWAEIVQTIELPLISSSRTNKDFLVHSGYPKPGDIPLLNRKIFKGTRVSINEHPYVVSIRRLYSHYAMGCLLTRTVVISVAHPFVDVPVTDLGVVSGENYADRGHFLINVLFLVIHEDFDRTTLNADLALITTIRDIEFRNKVKPIMLIEPKKPIANKNAFVTGWGRCAQNGPEICLPRSSKYYPDEILDMMLMSISFQIKLPNRSCLVYKNNEVDFKPGMLCVGVARQVEPNCSCLGVPGAPLVVDSTLLGLQSWGLGCGYQHDLPLVYTDMMYYERWLVHNINILQLLGKSNLTTIIEATNSYIAALWLRTTRVIKPPSYMYVNKELEPMTFDKYIVKLKGTVYDIRDVIKEGAFSKMKQEMLKKLRKEEKMINYLRKDKTKIEVRPFLNKNIRVADVTDKVYDDLNDLIVEDDESDTDNVTNSVEEDTGDNY
uniref:Peptidase S1 domain-containing protein n=2 Tax=Bombyx mori TaxID=7091 RepID=A0A8R1WJ84_BOMMO|nr:trypsin-4 [Bombyx mori]